MFESSHKLADSGNTLTAFLLTVSFVLMPAALIFLRTVAYLPLGLALVASALCVVVAWLNWKRSSTGPAAVAVINEIGK